MAGVVSYLKERSKRKKGKGDEQKGLTAEDSGLSLEPETWNCLTLDLKEKSKGKRQKCEKKDGVLRTKD